MNYGSEKTIHSLDKRGSTISTTQKYRRGEIDKVMKHYSIKVLVKDSREEMVEFMRFTDEISRCRKNGTLTYDKDDTTTKASFIIEYPKENTDGSYFITKSYTVFDIH